MLDLKFIRENFALVQEGIRRKNAAVDLEEVRRLDNKRRELIVAGDEKKAGLNKLSRDIASLMKEGKSADELKKKGKELSSEIGALDEGRKNVEALLKEALLRIPNIPHKDIPTGDASCNRPIKEWGGESVFDFVPRDHIELANDLALVDFERGAKIGGSGFVLFTGTGASLVRALINFMLDLHSDAHGYSEVFPPFLVRRECMTGTGQLPNLEEDMYRTSTDDLFLIPTAEVPVTNMYREEILPESRLPLYHTAYSACFRREAGSYGKGTKGLVRVHQFDKVELVKFVKPEDSYSELERLLKDAEEVLRLLELRYRVMMLASGDLSFAAAKCYDIEVYAPGMKRWLEVSSCSNFEDFQARRSNIRLKRKDGSVEFVHTLNGSGVALPRLIIALLEQHQQKDGSVTVPRALQKYWRNHERIQRRP